MNILPQTPDFGTYLSIRVRRAAVGRQPGNPRRSPSLFDFLVFSGGTVAKMPWRFGSAAMAYADLRKTGFRAAAMGPISTGRYGTLEK